MLKLFFHLEASQTDANTKSHFWLALGCQFILRYVLIDTTSVVPRDTNTYKNFF